MKNILLGLFYLIIRSNILFAQELISHFEYGKPNVLDLSFNISSINGNKNLIYISKQQGQDNSTESLDPVIFLNKVEKDCEILPGVRYKKIADLSSNSDGTLNILVVDENGSIYNLKTYENNSYDIVEIIQPRGLTHYVTYPSYPKYFQGDVLYFSDRALYRQRNGKAEFVCEASEGGFTKYITDNKNYVFIANHGYVIFNGETYRDNPLRNNKFDYFFKDGRLFVSANGLYEIKKLSNGFDFVKAFDNVFLDKSNSEDYTFYNIASQNGNTIKYTYDLKENTLVVTDSMVFSRIQTINEKDYSLEIAAVVLSGYLGYKYNVKVNVNPEGGPAYSIMWINSNTSVHARITNKIDSKLLLEISYPYSMSTSSKNYLYIDLKDSTQSKVFTPILSIDSDLVMVKYDSELESVSYNILDFRDLSVRPVENPSLVIEKNNYNSKLYIKEHYDRLSVSGVSNLSNSEEYEKYNNYSSLIVKLNPEKIDTKKYNKLGFDVFYNNDSISKEVIHLDSNHVIIKDNLSNEEISLHLPYELNKEMYGEYSIYFPNNQVVLINTKNGIYYYNFNLGKLELVYNSYNLYIDSFTNGIIIYPKDVDGEKIFSYCFFGRKTTSVQRRSKNFGKFNAGFKKINQSLVAFYHGEDDLLFNINEDGYLTEIKPFWKKRIVTFGRNGDEILVVATSGDLDQHILYSSKFYPVSVPFGVSSYLSFVTRDDMYFSQHYNDYYFLAKFNFQTRKFYLLDENIVKTKIGDLNHPIYSFAILRNDELLYSCYFNSQLYKYSSPKFYGGHDYAFIKHGLNKGVYAIGSYEESNPQVYKLDTSNFSLNWKPIGSDDFLEYENEEINVKIYPNPTSDYVNVISAGLVDKIEVFDLNGKIILDAWNTSKLNLEKLPTGTYILRVWSGVKYDSKRIIKL